jgi:hypothetical protein
MLMRKYTPADSGLHTDPQGVASEEEYYPLSGRMHTRKPFFSHILLV